MGVVSFSIPRALVTEIVRKASVRNFIETGTFKGNTSVWAGGIFEKVYTIEINPELRKIASERKDAGKNIEFLLGSSDVVLPGLVKRLEGRSFFWLDGHWCVGAGDKKEHECPLIDELRAISVLQDSIIFIDDARCFMGPLPPPHETKDWPKIDEIFIYIKQLFPQHTTTIIDDVIVSVPADINPIVEQYWQKTYNDRFYKPGTVLDRFSKFQILKYLVGG